MSWRQKILLVGASLLFCMLLVRAAQRPLATGGDTAAPLAATAVRNDTLPANLYAAVGDLFTYSEKSTTVKKSESTMPQEFLTNPKIPVIGAASQFSPSPSSLAEKVTPLLPERSDKLAVNPPRQNTPYREIWAQVTAYCPCARCCGSHARGRTSLGNSAWVPGIAADPRALPYGTKVAVPGYGAYSIDDTGGAMRRSWDNRGIVHIDLRMKWHSDARAWGKRWMKVRVYE